jgi:hypothetical protein
MTLRHLRRRLDRIEADRQPKLPPLILWHDGDDRDIQRQAEIARAQGRQVMLIRWRSGDMPKLN